MAGCWTPVSNIVMSMVVMLTLLVITPLFKYTPNAVLAAIIISAVLHLIDIEAAYTIWKVDKFDFIACIGAFFGVVFISIEIGLLIAVSHPCLARINPFSTISILLFASTVTVIIHEVDCL